MTKKKYIGYYNIVKNEEARHATIYIYGIIGGFDYETWSWINTSDSFLQEFKEVEKQADTIHIRINSPGGNVHDGLAIFNAIQNSEKTIHTYNDGICYSMAALLLLAGDKSSGFNNSLFMTHNVISAVWGNAKEMRDEAAVLDKYDEALSTAIEDKLNITAEEVKEKYLNFSDNYFTAKEAMSEGFYNEIIKKKTDKLPENVKDLSPQNLLEHYSKMNFEFETKKQNPPKNTTMKKFALVFAALGIETLASTEEGSYLNEAQFEMLENEISASNKKATDAEAALTTAQTAQKNAENTANSHVTVIEGFADSLGAEKGNSVSETIKNIEARVAEINKNPGARHTNIGKKKQNGSTDYSYINFESSIYKN